MASTSLSEIAEEVLGLCLRGHTWPADRVDLLAAAALHEDPRRAEPASRALFGTLVEGLADRFDPRLAALYSELFARVIVHALPQLDAAQLAARYQRVRRPKRFEGAAPRKVFVLSRVTLGADVAVTSVILDAMKRRFPDASIALVGPRKNWELFAADRRIEPALMAYQRQATLGGRLSIWEPLRELLAEEGAIVVDPDSRLTQLGLLPVCGEDRYFFFESRAYGGDSLQPLPALAREWVSAAFGVDDAQAFIAPAADIAEATGPVVTVSLGVGDNPAKRIADPFETNLLAGLARAGVTVWVDKGGGGEETARVERAIANCGAPAGRIRTWDGAFAPFAALIARSALYVGYDSAGQHVAAACGTPLVSVFAGFPCERMFERWRPSGAGPVRVIRAKENNPEKLLVETLRAVFELEGAKR